MDKIPAAVMEELKKAAQDGRVTCEEAHAIADRLGVDRILVGQAADELKIKIRKCQLGCF